jgi:hypothetical protein
LYRSGIPGGWKNPDPPKTERKNCKLGEFKNIIKRKISLGYVLHTRMPNV